MWLFVAVLFILLGVGAARLWQLRIKRVAQQLQDVVLAARRSKAEIAAQNGLDQNLDMLRGALFGLGLPRRRGQELYFGDRLINGDTEIVDRVRAALGGAATIFLGDLRIATNVQGADGARAIGTTLAAGPAYDRVLGQGLSYRGEAMILGQPYIALYEPILEDNEVIGVMFAGVTKAKAVPAPARLASLADSVGALREVIQSQADVAQQGMAARQEAEDQRRRLDAARAAEAVKQAEAVAVLSAALERLAKGDLACQITQRLAPDYEPLRIDFNTTVAQLRETIQAVIRNTGDVSNGAEEIRRAADDLARRTEQQAATLEETAAALDGITTTVNATATAAQTMRNAIAQARTAAQTSNGVLRDAVTAMDGIEGKSREIANTIGFIDEIAFQTNLLALNAGVEAARAGDAGRGFAVVAAEVRALAQRSADAAKTIKSLIAASGEQVQQGVHFVGDTAAALAGISAQIDSLNTTMTEIAASASHQASGLGEVNTAVTQMDRATQQNAAMVEETTAASNQLAREAAGLLALLRRFHTEAPARQAMLVAGE